MQQRWASIRTLSLLFGTEIFFYFTLTAFSVSHQIYSQISHRGDCLKSWLVWAHHRVKVHKFLFGASSKIQIKRHVFLWNLLSCWNSDWTVLLCLKWNINSQKMRAAPYGVFWLFQYQNRVMYREESMKDRGEKKMVHKNFFLKRHHTENCLECPSRVKISTKTPRWEAKC